VIIDEQRGWLLASRRDPGRGRAWVLLLLEVPVLGPWSLFKVLGWVSRWMGLRRRSGGTLAGSLLLSLWIVRVAPRLGRLGLGVLSLSVDIGPRPPEVG
jgi:hypothetical protein